MVETLNKLLDLVEDWAERYHSGSIAGMTEYDRQMLIAAALRSDAENGRMPDDYYPRQSDGTA